MKVISPMQKCFFVNYSVCDFWHAAEFGMVNLAFLETHMADVL